MGRPGAQGEGQLKVTPHVARAARRGEGHVLFPDGFDDDDDEALASVVRGGK